MALQPDSPDVYFNFGAILRNLGRLDEAKVRYQNAIALKPDSTQAHHN
ncbi:MAG: hypothetical protein CMP92_07380 [Gammaproteobacteria bacterium]|nr:hypothetical protein [Gammaproteobacteria bacterium]